METEPACRPRAIPLKICILDYSSYQMWRFWILMSYHGHVPGM
jgi:hypothetical protein